jgi:L-asparaginase II
MANPILVEVTRGGIVESRHRGVVAVSLASGELVLAIGDVAGPIFPRSSVKPMQVLAAITAGAIERFGFGDKEIAVMCASHNGEAPHLDAVRSVLEKIGAGEEHLECGAHWPRHAETARALARGGSGALAIHNNCSGKHAGMLALARLMDVEPAGYVAPDHPVQLRIRSVLEQFFAISLASAPCGTDGCSVPTYAVAPAALALGFARFATGEGLAGALAGAAKRVAAAIAAEPFMVAGSERFCTEAMRSTGARALVKVGAEGVMCAGLPGRGLGIAIKCDDGATRGAEVIMAQLLAAFGAADPDEPGFARLMTRQILNANDIHVGDIRAAEALGDAISRNAAAMIA